MYELFDRVLDKVTGKPCLVIDVRENPNISDVEGRDMIANSLRRHSMPSASMINHDGRIEMATHP